MVTRPHGFSLIELAITLALVGVLALMVGPFTINWLVLSDIQRAKGQLVQAHGVARAVALRNRPGLIGADAVVAIEVDDTSKELRVIGCTRTGCDGEPLWQAQLPRGISLSFDSGATAIELDNTGRLITVTGVVSYQISKGGQSEDGGLY